LLELRMAEHLGSATSLVEFVVERALVSGAGWSLQQMFGCSDVARVDVLPAVPITQRLREVDLLPHALRAERVLAWDALNRVLVQDLSKEGRGYVKALSADGALRNWWGRERLAMLDMFERAIALAQKPYCQSAGERQKFGALFDELGERKLPLTMLLLPTMARSLTTRAHRRTCLRQMALGIELELHRRAAGSYPNTLDDLKLAHLDEVPVDPFSGQPFRYRKEGEGYLLYSVDENGVDDGGVQERQHRQFNEEKGIYEDVAEKDDIAWSVGIDEGK